MKKIKYNESKVFLFGKEGWLYCNDLSHKDGIYRGNVINGSWHLFYDTKTKHCKSYKSREEERLGWKPVSESIVELTWACGELKGRGYNEILENAKQRYESGEQPNFDLVEREYEDDGIPY